MIDNNLTLLIKSLHTNNLLVDNTLNNFSTSIDWTEKTHITNCTLPSLFSLSFIDNPSLLSDLISFHNKDNFSSFSSTFFQDIDSFNSSFLNLIKFNKNHILNTLDYNNSKTNSIPLHHFSRLFHTLLTKQLQFADFYFDNKNEIDQQYSDNNSNSTSFFYSSYLPSLIQYASQFLFTLPTFYFYLEKNKNSFNDPDSLINDIIQHSNYIQQSFSLFNEKINLFISSHPNKNTDSFAEQNLSNFQKDKSINSFFEKSAILIKSINPNFDLTQYPHLSEHFSNISFNKLSFHHEFKELFPIFTFLSTKFNSFNTVLNKFISTDVDTDLDNDVSTNSNIIDKSKSNSFSNNQFIYYFFDNFFYQFDKNLQQYNNSSIFINTQLAKDNLDKKIIKTKQFFNTLSNLDLKSLSVFLNDLEQNHNFSFDKIKSMFNLNLKSIINDSLDISSNNYYFGLFEIKKIQDHISQLNDPVLNNFFNFSLDYDDVSLSIDELIFSINFELLIQKEFLSNNNNVNIDNNKSSNTFVLNQNNSLYHHTNNEVLFNLIYNDCPPDFLISTKFIHDYIDSSNPNFSNENVSFIMNKFKSVNNQTLLTFNENYLHIKEKVILNKSLNENLLHPLKENKKSFKL